MMVLIFVGLVVVLFLGAQLIDTLIEWHFDRDNGDPGYVAPAHYFDNGGAHNHPILSKDMQYVDSVAFRQMNNSYVKLMHCAPLTEDAVEQILMYLQKNKSKHPYYTNMCRHLVELHMVGDK